MGNNQSVLENPEQSIHLTDNQLNQILDTLKRPTVNSLLSLLKSPQLSLFQRIDQQQRDTLEITLNTSLDLFASRRTFKEINFELFNILMVAVAFVKGLTVCQMIETYYNILFNAECQKQRYEKGEDAIEKIVLLFISLKSIIQSNIIITLEESFKTIIKPSLPQQPLIVSTKCLISITDDFIKNINDILKESLKLSLTDKWNINSVVKAIHSLSEFENSEHFEIVKTSQLFKEYGDTKSKLISKYMKVEEEHLEFIITSISQHLSEINYLQQIDEFFFSVSSILNNGLLSNNSMIIQTFIHSCEIYISSFYITLKKINLESIQQINSLVQFNNNLSLIITTTAQSIQLINERYHLNLSYELLGYHKNLEQSSSLLHETIKKYILTFNDLFKQPLKSVEEINYKVEPTDDLTKNIYSMELFIQKIKEIVDTKIDGLEKQTQKNIVSGCTDYIVKQLEFLVRKKTFTQFGACEFMKDLQQIQSLFKSYGVPLQCFEKLKQTSTVLCLDQIEDITKYCSVKGWKLSSLEIKLIMTLRVDFSKQKIRSLQL
ncbi:hypothetical protein, conserved [Entamoeba histolytica]